MVSIGFADHMGRVLFTVCVDDRQPPPKTFFDPEKILCIYIYIYIYIHIYTCIYTHSGRIVKKNSGGMVWSGVGGRCVCVCGGGDSCG